MGRIFRKRYEWNRGAREVPWLQKCVLLAEIYCSGSQPVVRGPLVVRGLLPGGPRAKHDNFFIFKINLAIGSVYDSWGTYH